MVEPSGVKSRIAEFRSVKVPLYRSIERHTTDRKVSRCDVRSGVDLFCIVKFRPVKQPFGAEYWSKASKGVLLCGVR